MNERIKELAIEAGANLYHDLDRPNDGPFLRLKHIGIEKFAELIVRECCEVAHCNFHVDGLTLGGILKEHFGVDSTLN